MGKDFNIQSQEWLDLIFEGRNKEYGAYVVRQKSGIRNVLALVLVLLFAVLIAFLPLIVSSIQEAAARRHLSDNLTDATVLADLSKIEDVLPEENIIRQIEEIEPPKLKSAMQFVVPEIVDESEYDKDKAARSQDEVLDSDLDISLKDIVGSDDPDAIDYASVRVEQTVITDPKVEKEPERHPEQPATFPGGEAALYKFLSDNIVFPQLAADNGVKGRVMVEFVVGLDGSISNAKVLRKLDPLCDEEALRVIRSMPKWNPARQNGKAVRSYFTMPIVFELR